MLRLFSLWRFSASALLIACVWTVPAAHAQSTQVSVAQGEDYRRLIFTWPADDRRPLNVSASVENGVLVARFNREVFVDPAIIVEAAPDDIAMARLDSDGRTLRLALKQPVRAGASTSYNIAAVDLIAPNRVSDPSPVFSERARAEQAAQARRQARLEAEAQAAAAPPPALPLNVTYAQTTDYARIIFQWTSPVGHRLEETADGARVVFDRDAVPDLAPLNALPPEGLERVAAERSPESLAVAFTLSPGYRTRSWTEGPRVVVDIFSGDANPPPPPPSRAEGAPALEADEAPVIIEPRAVPLPAGPPPLVRAQAARAPGGFEIAFAWDGPVGAAAFRRGDGLWIVFDRPAQLDVGQIQRAGGRVVRRVAQSNGADHAAVRLAVADTSQIAVQESGSRWVFHVTDAVAPPPRLMQLQRLSGDGEPARIVADVPALRAVRVEDPIVGDTLLVAPAPAPVTVLPVSRRFLELTVLSSAHGLAISPLADDIEARATGREVVISRPGGLTLSPTRTAPVGARNLARTLTATPGFVDFGAVADRKVEFADDLKELANEAATGDRRSEAILAEAQFLLAHELATESLGVLGELLRQDPVYINDPRVRATRGAARLLAGRLAEAQRDLAFPALRDDPASALWRGYAATEEAEWGDARRAFQAGEEAFFLYNSDWRARFQVRAAHAALQMGDFAEAKALADRVLAADTTPRVRAQARLVLADYHEGLGDGELSLNLNRELAASEDEAVRVRAAFNVLRMEQAKGALSLEDAAEELERLRLRWRGDDIELNVTHALAKLYLDSGAPREGLALMRALVQRYPDEPQSRAISRDMAETFKALFLGDMAVGFDPVEALALWYEFRDLTPEGAEGDRLIRRLVDRLVDFDLLAQAAELLEHQVENRLEGASRAIIGTDLAAIYLMDRDPEAALRIIASTRITRLPDGVNRERRLIQARALSELGRHEHALELLSTDRSAAAARERADIAWRRQDWAQAGLLMAESLGEAWRAPGPLDTDTETRVIKAAIAMTLAQQSQGLANLSERYGAKMARGRQAATWAVITDDVSTDGVRLRDLAREIADEDSIDAFISEFRARRSATGVAPT